MAIQTGQSPQSCWRNMATIEVDRRCGDLSDVLEDLSFDSRFEAVSAPPAKLRFNLVVNASRGFNRSAMATFALLSALEAIAEEGGLPGFRIVAGEHWLDHANAIGPRAAAISRDSAP